MTRLCVRAPGRAVVGALAAGHAARCAHRHVEVEGDPRCVALAHAADDVVFLDDVAAAHAAVAEDAGVVIDGDDERRVVAWAARSARRSSRDSVDPKSLRQRLELAVAGVLLFLDARGRVVGHRAARSAS